MATPRCYQGCREQCRGSSMWKQPCLPDPGRSPPLLLSSSNVHTPPEHPKTPSPFWPLLPFPMTPPFAGQHPEALDPTSIKSPALCARGHRRRQIRNPGDAYLPPQTQQATHHTQTWTLVVCFYD
ncbi:uncharacterized protein LY89DRAFT_738105 [Mollisia scopiformis]|uniref:Uncharacterized protein n=1 Tax=Mollisia scopiformis TaxID=149040 RepID=A0A194WWJ0_MOLSC|nr:uncharacterized protein LY89DRAFT_738105 [Mollisia scopiformis]KUJ12315.1 hypothetical protein LY89DRAFT_738105 [Mollisia scopiformis]